MVAETPPIPKPIEATIAPPRREEGREPQNVTFQGIKRILRIGKSIADSGSYINPSVSSGKGHETAMVAKQTLALKAAAADLTVQQPDSHYNSKTGEYEVADPKDPTKKIKKNLSEEIPGFIAAAEEVIAQGKRIPQPADGKDFTPEQLAIKAQSAEAETVLQSFTQYVEVEVTYQEPVLEEGKPKMSDSGQPETHTISQKMSYAEHQQLSLVVALKLSGLSPEDFQKLKMDDQDAYIFQARQQLGGSYSIAFDQSPQEVKQPEQALTYEQLQKQTGDAAMDALAELGKLDPRNAEDLKKLEKIDPSGSLTRLTVLLPTYQEAVTNGRTEQAEFLAALMAPELASLDLSSLSSPKADAIKQQIEVLRKNKAGFAPKLAELRKRVAQASGVTENMITTDHILRNLMLAYTCEGKLYIDQQTSQIKAPQDIETVMNHWYALGEATSTDRTIILNLAGYKRAGTMLHDTLGFNTDTLKSKDATTIYARKAVSSLVETQRIPEGERVSYEERLKAYMEHMLTKLKGEKRNWHKLLIGAGLLFGIFAPGFQGILSDSGEAAGGGQQRR